MNWCTDPHAVARRQSHRPRSPAGHSAGSTVRGLDQVPGAGPLVIVMNHCSLI